MTEEQFLSALKEKGIVLNERQMEQFETYYTLLVEWNEKMNLTAITDREEVYLKHFYDSISMAFYVDLTQPMTVCDVGAGAGFPSIPLKICFPNLHVTIVDSLNKRITFLNHLAEQLELDGVQFVHDRAETFGQNPKYREQFDLVTARAVARLSVLSELCLPLVKRGGQFVSMKGAAAENEHEDAKGAIRQLGGILKEEYAFSLPQEESDRHIFVFYKKRATPKKFPRKTGTPNESTLK